MSNEIEEFEDWYNNTFLCSRNPSSMLLNSECKLLRERFDRIGEVCKMMIKNPKQDPEKLREEVALDFFVSLRIALDYLNYAKLVLKKWNEYKETLDCASKGIDP